MPSLLARIASLMLFLLPCIVGSACAVGYAVKLLSAHPHGKESWIEEALYTMAFHAICLTVVFPLFIVVVASNWRFFRKWWCKLLILIGMLIAMALIVVLPELVVNRMNAKHSPCGESRIGTENASRQTGK